MKKITHVAARFLAQGQGFAWQDKALYCKAKAVVFKGVVKKIGLKAKA